MIGLFIIFIIWVIVPIFLIIDVCLYSAAKYPERTKYGHWPGSGFVAYFKIGKED